MLSALTSVHCAAGAATQQPWERSQLPHVRRCRGCVAAYLPGDTPVQAGPSEDDPGLLARGVPATGVDIRTACGTNEEVAGVAALRDVLAGHDLRRWMFTDLVVVDETISGGLSHPLTTARSCWSAARPAHSPRSCMSSCTGSKDPASTVPSSRPAHAGLIRHRLRPAVTMLGLPGCTWAYARWSTRASACSSAGRPQPPS
jgi:hypothetical protein